MKTRSITTPEELRRAANDLLALEGYLPITLTVTEGARIRTEGQNSRHWAEVRYFREQIEKAVEQVSEHTGYTPLEVRKVLAAELPIEQIAILFASTDEVIHDVLKAVVGIPTSTRLGTKEFSKFDDRLAQVMTEIIGSINAVTGRAIA